MTTFTDVLVLIILGWAFFRGWQKGIITAIIGPIVFVFFSIVAVINYDANYNVVKSILIALIGTILTSTIIRVGLFFAKRSVNKEFRNHVFFTSRVAGSVLNTLWKGCIVATVLMVLTLLPGRMLGIESMQQNILSSQAYGFIMKHIVEKDIKLKSTVSAFSVFRNSHKLSELSYSREYQDITSDPKVKSLLSDQELKKAIKKKDVLKILLSQKVLNTLTDKGVIKKLSNLSKKIYAKRVMTAD